jgi:hexokinase
MSRVAAGLASDNQEIGAHLTYVPIRAESPSGTCIVVDLGGTRVRAAVCAVEKGRFSILGNVAEALLPVTRGVPLPKETYLRVQADLVASLKPPSGLPLGYCFSYPAAPSLEGDAKLVRWTKEVFVPGTEGQPVGRPLLDALALRGVSCRRVRVVNDTVASLLAGVPSAVAGAGHVGVIVGTGTNVAMALPSAAVPKFPASIQWQGSLPVNLESGNFTPPHLSHVDDAVDAGSEAPGRQRFEKAVSGVYLGRVLAAAAAGSGFDPSSGSRGVVEAAAATDNPALAGAARALLRRSALLTAACLAGASLLLHGNGFRSADIVAEGSLFWGAPGYADAVRTVVEQLVSRHAPGLEVTIRPVEHANLVGSATAALAA